MKLFPKSFGYHTFMAVLRMDFPMKSSPMGARGFKKWLIFNSMLSYQNAGFLGVMTGNPANLAYQLSLLIDYT